MEEIILWVYLIFSFGIACALEIYTLRLRKHELILISSEKEVSQELLTEIELIKKQYSMLFFEKGNLYAYDSRRKVIKYKDKHSYSCLDAFALYHELGHYIDDLDGDKIYHNMTITVLNRMIVIPMYIISAILSVMGFECFKVARLVVLCVVLALSAHRLFFIIRYEGHASKYAINTLQKQKNVYIEKIRLLAKDAIVQQILFSILGVMFIFLIEIIIADMKMNSLF